MVGMSFLPAHQKFTPENIARAIEIAETGATNKIIGDSLGVSEATFQNWIRFGRESQQRFEEQGEELNDYGQFWVELSQARADLAVDMTKVVTDTAMSGQPNTWQAAMTYLERRYPNEWGRQEKRIHEGNTGPQLPQINILVMNDPSARTAHRDLLRSVDASNRTRTGVPVGTRVVGELEAGQHDGGDDIDVDSR